ncbi:MAG: hypothetical protein EOM15_00995 [Spirochaetia bacterium]|nr:hypothetical protein [Spirochaetia bacterium]
MRVHALVAVLMVLLSLIGCKEPSLFVFCTTYEEGQSIVGFAQDKSLMLLVLPQSLVQTAIKDTGFSAFDAIEDLLDVPLNARFTGNAVLLDQYREIATTLVVNTKGIEDRDKVDGRMRLASLSSGAGYLRKTPLKDTLASVVGFEDPFAFLEEYTQFEVFDLTDVLQTEDFADYKRFRTSFAYYVEELLRYQRRSFNR